MTERNTPKTVTMAGRGNLQVTELLEKMNLGSSPGAQTIAVKPQCVSRAIDWVSDDVVSVNSQVRSVRSRPTRPEVPQLKKLLSSSDNSASSTNSSEKESWESSGSGVVQETDSDLDRALHAGTSGQPQPATVNPYQGAARGFLYGNQPGKLKEYLVSIISQPLEFGIYIWKDLQPKSVEGVMRYREGHEFDLKKKIHSSPNSSCGVFLCRDKTSRAKFIWKKIKKERNRLIGIEFLTEHNQHFLPLIYGVYKEKDAIHIFEEFIGGGTLLTCDWNLMEVHKFAKSLLVAIKYLHCHDLVHGDIKLGNLMVRDQSKPESLVIIDFESAKHPQYPYHKGGHTISYLPPWHEQILNLTSFTEAGSINLLKSADLWAVACVIVFFLIPSDRTDLQNRGVWAKIMEDILKDCQTCKGPVKTYCQRCRGQFLHFVEKNGHKILEIHLGPLMEAEIDDPHWKTLKEVLGYLTRTDNIQEKHVDIALSIMQEQDCHLTVDVH